MIPDSNQNDFDAIEPEVLAIALQFLRTSIRNEIHQRLRRAPDSNRTDEFERELELLLRQYRCLGKTILRLRTVPSIHV